MTWKAVVTVLGLSLAAPSGALAAGGPVPPVQGGDGIGVPGGTSRLIASPAGRDTLVRRVTAGSGHVQATLRLPGHYGIPDADYHGTLTGLSADGRTLILAQRFGAAPVGTTRLIVLDTRRMRIERRIVLPGWSTVDAISPDGRWIYLIHYSSSNPANYEVLAYDLSAGRLLSKPIVDPHDRGEQMTGIPFRRVMSPDRRWAYTLYARPSGVPFVHALNTAGLRAVCIDLPSLESMDIGAATFSLGPGASTLEVKIAGFVAATISTRTFAVRAGRPVSANRPAPPPRHAAPPADGGGSTLPWELIFVPIIGVAALGTVAWRRAKPRTA
jgi:hypothetical protein